MIMLWQTLLNGDYLRVAVFELLRHKSLTCMKLIRSNFFNFFKMQKGVSGPICPPPLRTPMIEWYIEECRPGPAVQISLSPYQPIHYGFLRICVRHFTLDLTFGSFLLIISLGYSFSRSYFLITFIAKRRIFPLLFKSCH